MLPGNNEIIMIQIQQQFNVLMFSGRPILLNAISQERREGISSNLAQTSTQTEGWTD